MATKEDHDRARAEDHRFFDREPEERLERRMRPEETVTRAWLEAMVAAGWTIEHQWWDSPPEGATREEKEATVSAQAHRDPLTVDRAIALMTDGGVRTYEFTGPNGASFSICGWLK